MSYPCVAEPMWDQCGDEAYFSKGHHSWGEMIRQIAQYESMTAERAEEHCDGWGLWQGYFRTMPGRGSGELRYLKAESSCQGSYPVTVVGPNC